MLEIDSNNGYFKDVNTSAYLPLYADAYYGGKRVSLGLVNLSQGGQMWFGYIGRGGADYNGKNIQARASTSNADPNSNNVTLTFAP